MQASKYKVHGSTTERQTTERLTTERLMTERLTTERLSVDGEGKEYEYARWAYGLILELR